MGLNFARLLEIIGFVTLELAVILGAGYLLFGIGRKR